MKKPTRPPPRPPLSHEDETLWDATAGTLEPLKTRKSRVRAVGPSPTGESEAGQAKNQTARVPKVALAGPKKPLPPAPPPAAKSAPPLADFDRGKARKIRSGRIDIDARIDLHGLRQAEAHSVLRRFLVDCHRRRVRWVLVITGKGAPARRDATAAADFGPSERGVLRMNVPRWLAEPELRALIVSFTTAAPQHGGEGALYVHLRNPDRRPEPD